MRKIVIMLAIFVGLSLTAHADTVILGDGASYTGEFMGTVIHFTDQQGVQYTPSLLNDAPIMNPAYRDWPEGGGASSQ